MDRLRRIQRFRSLLMRCDMDNNFPLLNCDRKVQHGNFAGIPGTGPVGAVCSKCSRLEPAGSRFVCSHFQILTGRKGKPISSGSAACRYFLERPAFNAAKG